MNQPPMNYRVLRVQDSSSYDREHGTHATKVVWYELEDKTKSSVEIPIHEYEPATVQAAIEDAIAKHVEVMSLKPGYMPQQPMGEPGPFG